MSTYIRSIAEPGIREKRVHEHVEITPFIFPDEGVFGRGGKYWVRWVQMCIGSCVGGCGGDVDLFGAVAVVGAAAVGEDYWWMGRG